MSGTIERRRGTCPSNSQTKVHHQSDLFTHQSQSSSRLVNTLLTEMDGMSNRKQVYVIAATNRPDMIDPAMLRPGRLDKALYVDLPNSTERLEILKAVSRKTPLGPDVELAAVASDVRCDGFSGADLAALVREAAVAALRDGLFSGIGAPNGVDVQRASEKMYVEQRHFDVAFRKVVPSVNKKVGFCVYDVCIQC